jgi:hypothetical protein
MIRARLLAGFIIAVVGVSSAGAQGNGNGSGKGNGQGKSSVAGQPAQTPNSGQRALSVVITAGERQTILGYFQQHPAGYAGIQPLPPGIAKKIARGGTMPPGIAKRYFPGALIGLLPARPGQQWLIAGTDVLLVQVATNLILDILPRVF